MNVTLNVTLRSYSCRRYHEGNVTLPTANVTLMLVTVTLPTVNITFRIHAEPAARVTFLTSRNRT
jgi:hypothetical protein